MVANERLDKARAWPLGTDSLVSIQKDMKATLLLNFWDRAECTLKRKIPAHFCKVDTDIENNLLSTLCTSS